MKKKIEGKFTLGALVKYCNENFSKKNGEQFTHSNIQQYAMLGHLPFYLEKKVYIEKIDDDSIQGAKLYEIYVEED